MGFIIIENIDIQEVGLSLPNLYCSLKGEYSIIRTPYPDTYSLCGNLYIYATQTAKICLRQTRVFVDFKADNYPSDPIALLYTHCKTLYPDKTFLDV